MSVTSITPWKPGDTQEWITVLRQREQANLAQAPQWFSAIQQAYGHTPLYLRGENTLGQIAVLPSFLIRRPLLGTIVTSMPFLDAGGPCSPATDLAQVLVHRLITEATRRGASLVEIRATEAMALPVLGTYEKVNMVLSLPDQADCLWRQLSAKVRNQIRKAERSGLSVVFGHLEYLDDFYTVFAAHMRELGSPVHAYAFFSTVLEAFAESARVVVVRQGSIPIGGLIALAFQDTLVVPWASSLRQYFSLCPNMLLYWETLRAACQEGFRRFEFGRSSRGSNTYHFKRQWGAVEAPLFWYTIPLGQSMPAGSLQHDRHKVLFGRLWRCLPLSVTRWIGPSVRKYITL